MTHFYSSYSRTLRLNKSEWLACRQEKKSFSLYFRRQRLETINRNSLLSLTNPTHGALVTLAAKHQTKCCSRNSKTIHSPRPSSARPAKMASRRPSFQDARSPLLPQCQTSSFQEVRSEFEPRNPLSSRLFPSYRFMCIWIEQIFSPLRPRWYRLMRINSHNGKFTCGFSCSPN